MKDRYSENRAVRVKKGCVACGRTITLSSQTLPICLDCLRSGKEAIEPVILEAHHQSRKLFQLVDQPPRDASGRSCQICVNECRIPEGGWGYCGLRIE